MAAMGSLMIRKMSMPERVPSAVIALKRRRCRRQLGAVESVGNEIGMGK